MAACFPTESKEKYRVNIDYVKFVGVILQVTFNINIVKYGGGGIKGIIIHQDIQILAP